MRKKKDPSMQIILVQSEVEEALRAYIGSRLTLAEGTTIKIDLSATRGADGIKATIDLVEPGAQQVVIAAAPPAPVKAAATLATTVLAKDAGNTALESAKATLAAATTPKTQDAPVLQAAEASTTDAAVDAGAATTAAGEASGPAEAAEAGTEASAGGEPQPAPQTKSLFAGLNRPKNS